MEAKDPWKLLRRLSFALSSTSAPWSVEIHCPTTVRKVPMVLANLALESDATLSLRSDSDNDGSLPPLQSPPTPQLSISSRRSSSAMDGGFKDERDPDGAKGCSSSSFSTPRWRQSNNGPREFIAHCSEKKSRSSVSPVSLISPHLDKNSGGSNDGDQSSIGWQPRKWIQPCSLLSKATTTEASGVEVESVAVEENFIKSPEACPLLSNEFTKEAMLRHRGW